MADQTQPRRDTKVFSQQENVRSDYPKQGREQDKSYGQDQRQGQGITGKAADVREQKTLDAREGATDKVKQTFSLDDKNTSAGSQGKNTGSEKLGQTAQYGQEKAGQVKDQAKGLGQNVANKAQQGGEKAKEAGDKTMDQVEGVAGAAGDKFNQGIEYGKEKGGQVQEQAKGVTQTISEKAQQAGQATLQTGDKTMDTVEGAVGKVKQSLPTFSSGGSNKYQGDLETKDYQSHGEHEQTGYTGQAQEQAKGVTQTIAEKAQQAGHVLLQTGDKTMDTIEGAMGKVKQSLPFASSGGNKYEGDQQGKDYYSQSEHGQTGYTGQAQEQAKGVTQTLADNAQMAGQFLLQTGDKTMDTIEGAVGKVKETFTGTGTKESAKEWE